LLNFRFYSVIYLIDQSYKTQICKLVKHFVHDLMIEYDMNIWNIFDLCYRLFCTEETIFSLEQVILMFFFMINLCWYRVVQKLPASLWLRITFDRNKIESCGFRHWKEAVSLHSLISYSTLLVDHKIIGPWSSKKQW
jgi:hypothetical protein